MVIDTAQMVCCLLLHQMYAYSFRETKLNNSINYMAAIITCIGGVVLAQFHVSSFKESLYFAMFSLIVFSLISLYISFSKNVIRFLLNQSKKTHDLQDELNHIFVNLEESIIIMQDFKPEFVNQRFLCAFPPRVIDKLPQEPQVIVEKEYLSRLQRAKIYLKKVFTRKEEKVSQEEPKKIPQIIETQLFSIYKNYQSDTLTGGGASRIDNEIPQFPKYSIK